MSGCADEMQSPVPSSTIKGTFSPLVLLADCHWNMPYRSWQLSPSGPDSTLLTINGAHLQVKVEIKVGTAALLLSLPPTPLPATPTSRWGHVCACMHSCSPGAVCGVRGEGTVCERGRLCVGSVSVCMCVE